MKMYYRAAQMPSLKQETILVTSSPAPPIGYTTSPENSPPVQGFIITHTWHSSLRAPVYHYDSHLDSITFIISTPLYVTLPGSLTSWYCSCVSAFCLMLMSCSWFCCFIKTFHLHLLLTHHPISTILVQGGLSNQVLIVYHMLRKQQL